MGCVSILLGSHGQGPMVFMILNSLISLCCFVVCAVFVWQMQPVQTTVSNSGDHGRKKHHQKHFMIPVIIVLLTLSFTSVIYTVNYIVDLHTDSPLSTDKINYNSWKDYIESKCNFNLITTANIMLGLTISFVFFGYIGILLLYFKRLVLLFNGSCFSISKKSKRIFYSIFWFIFIVNIGLIPMYLIVGRYVVITIVGVSFILIVIMAVFVHRLLKRQFTSIIHMAIRVNMYSTMNNNRTRNSIANIPVPAIVSNNSSITSSPRNYNTSSVNDNNNNINIRNKTLSNIRIKGYIETLTRFTILFLVSLVSSICTTFIYFVFAATGLYYGSGNNVPIWRGVSVFLTSCDAFVNMLCIILQFSFIEKKFGLYKKCCYGCHTKYRKKYINTLNTIDQKQKQNTQNTNQNENQKDDNNA